MSDRAWHRPAVSAIVVDPDDRRRMAVAAAVPGRAEQAISLHDAYSLVEDNAPDVVLVALSAAGDSGLEMFLRMADLSGARCLAYGEQAPADMPAGLRWVTVADLRDIPSIVAAVTGAAGQCGARRTPDLIAIGASTGGIAAIEAVLQGFPVQCPPTLIVQHIRPGFIEGMIRRLARLCGPRILPAVDGLPLAPGHVYVAAEADCHLTVTGSRPRCRVVPGAAGEVHRPSVDALFLSCAGYGPSVSAAVLTGMGADGARGLAAIRAAGGHTIAQDRATSIVFGMPRVAAETGAAGEVLPLDAIAASLLAPPATPASPARARGSR